MTSPTTRTRVLLACCIALMALAGTTPAQARAGIAFDYAKASSTKLYEKSRNPLWFQYKLTPKSGDDLTVEVVRLGAGIVRSYPMTDSPRNQKVSVRWDGRNQNGKAPKAGRYAFKVRNANTGQVMRMKKVRGKRAFGFYRWIFPVRARHDFGDSRSRFGAVRRGHSHQGHDVFAKCGSRLFAPRAGRVQVRSYHSAAGNYVVLDLDGSPVDLVFMHLKYPSWAPVGRHLATAEQLGKVGETGAASGCHLHFEMWSGPGWYEGGKPFNPLKSLLAWDVYS